MDGMTPTERGWGFLYICIKIDFEKYLPGKKVEWCYNREVVLEVGKSGSFVGIFQLLDDEGSSFFWYY
jgi:hypothetical protein